MHNLHFVTFSDGSISFRAAGRRLCRQANESKLFSTPAKHWKKETLNEVIPQFFSTHNEFIKANPKGMGNYIWKPVVLLETLKSVEEGDVVLMLDSGCQLNLNQRSILRFFEYVELAKLHQALFMQIKDNSFEIDDLSEQSWTKSFTLNALDPAGDFWSSNQIQSGIIFIVNNEVTRAFVQNWYLNCVRDDYALLKSPNSHEEEGAKFINHRWEQSILSLMVKKSGFKYIVDETYWYPNWNDGGNFPIWAMRNRTGGDAFRRGFLDKFHFLMARLEAFSKH